MHYESPNATDMDNIRALNQAFLAMLRRSPAARKHLFGLRDDIVRTLIALTPRQAGRLAEAPFLLFSFREYDDVFWRTVFEANPNQDLFSEAQSLQTDVGSLIAAGLGFVWQMAKQNPYALRILCGASVHWCEQLSEHTLVSILGFASDNPDVLVVRLERKTEIWIKLLGDGISDKREVRRATHISALQTVLTQPQIPTHTNLAAAACRSTVPALKVADTYDH